MIAKLKNGLTVVWYAMLLPFALLLLTLMMLWAIGRDMIKFLVIRHTPDIPPKDIGRYHHDGHPKTEWELRQEAARMGGNTPWSDGTDASARAANERLFNGTTAAPSSWRGKDGA